MAARTNELIGVKPMAVRASAQYVAPRGRWRSWRVGHKSATKETNVKKNALSTGRNAFLLFATRCTALCGRSKRACCRASSADRNHFLMAGHFKYAAAEFFFFVFFVAAHITRNIL